MEQLNRMNRPAPVGGQVPVQAPVHNGGSPKKGKLKNKPVLKVVAIVLIALAVVLFALGAYRMYGANAMSSEIKTDKYQAVFLNSADGQVYFGKLAILNNDYYKLTDIYYVRVEQVQPGSDQPSQQNISLAKLGSEIHGPEDVMYIRQDQVLFWENLKDDGQVVKAIVEYRNNQQNQ